MQTKPDLGGGVLDLEEFPRSVSMSVALGLARLVTRAEAMGLLSEEHAIDGERVGEALSAFERAGIGRALVMQVLKGANPGKALEELQTEIEQCPVPEAEFRSVARWLGSDGLAELLELSPSTVRRYSAGTRSPSPEVAMWVHTLALLIADLAGSYNTWGVRQWFERPRRALGGHTPRVALARAYREGDDDAVLVVRGLAAALTAPLAT